MARYIDADVLKEELKMLTIFVTGMLCGKTHLTEVVAEYKKSLFKLIDEQPDADVVPRSEVEKLEETRADAAREIFEEINVTWSESYSVGEFFEDIAELKKKYTEGE